MDNRINSVNFQANLVTSLKGRHNILKSKFILNFFQLFPFKWKNNWFNLSQILPFVVLGGIYESIKNDEILSFLVGENMANKRTAHKIVLHFP